MKIAIVLVNHDHAANQEATEENLKTRINQASLGRIQIHGKTKRCEDNAHKSLRITLLWRKARSTDRP